MKKIIATSIIMFSMLFIGVGIFNILYFIGQFGDLATAGYGAALRVEQVFLLPVIGLNTAVLSIGGQNFGAKNYDRIRELYSKALLFGSSFMALAGLVLFFGAEFFVSQFTDNQEAILHGVIYLKIAALIGPVYPVFFITTAVFQALKKPIYSLYLSILRLIDRRFETSEIFIKWDDAPDEEWLILIYLKNNLPDEGIIIEDKTDPERNVSHEFKSNEIFKASDMMVDALTKLLDKERSKRKAS